MQCVFCTGLQLKLCVQLQMYKVYDYVHIKLMDTTGRSPALLWSAALVCNAIWWIMSEVALYLRACPEVAILFAASSLNNTSEHSLQ